ncbi:MAG: CoB--CoM heterodisulfide reductase iron-sulfur subunit B family protein [Candidatus Bipolaricaulia bacterium]
MRLFPGCTLSSSARPYRVSLDWLFDKLGLELQELPDWNCCGATSAHALRRDLAYALPARNLAIAQELQQDLIVPCSACYSRLKLTQQALSQNERLRSRVGRLVGTRLEPDHLPAVRNVLELLGDESLSKRVAGERTERLNGLKIACYYGCLLTRLPRVSGFASVENPQVMERLVTAAGAEPVDWPLKTACCGASLSVIQEAIALKLSTRILDMARRCAADLIVAACPFCQYNLDHAQWRRRHADEQIPVIFITQLLGLALGGDAGELMLSANLVGAESLVKL